MKFYGNYVLVIMLKSYIRFTAALFLSIFPVTKIDLFNFFSRNFLDKNNLFEVCDDNETTSF